MASANNSIDDDDDGSESCPRSDSTLGAVRHWNYIISTNTRRQIDDAQHNPADALYYTGANLEPKPYHCLPTNVSIDPDVPLKYVADNW